MGKGVHHDTKTGTTGAGVVVGSVESGGDLYLRSTDHATKGSVFVENGSELKPESTSAFILPQVGAGTPSHTAPEGTMYWDSTNNLFYVNNNGATAWTAVGSGSAAPVDATYLTTTANGTLTNEVVVGATPGGELGGTWASPTVDGTHSGSAHSDFIAKAFMAAKGDLIGASANDTPVILSVGSNGTLLMAASGETSGLKWGAPTTTRSLAFNLGDFAAMEGTPARTTYRAVGTTTQGFNGWAFDQATIEMIGTMFVLPDDWVSGSTIVTHWLLSVAADASEDVRVSARMGCSRAGSTMPGTSTGTDSAGVTIDVSSGAQFNIYSASFPLAPSGLVADDVCFLNIQRDAANATLDDYDSDLVLIGARMDYTATVAT